MSALFPVLVVAAALAIPLALRLRARRRYANLKVSGGRKALALYLADRSR